MIMNDFKLHNAVTSNDGENYQSIDLFLVFAELSRCRQMIQRWGCFPEKKSEKFESGGNR